MLINNPGAATHGAKSTPPSTTLGTSSRYPCWFRAAGRGFYQIHDVTAGGPGLVAVGLHDSGVREREDQGGFLFLDLFEGIRMPSKICQRYDLSR